MKKISIFVKILNFLLIFLLIIGTPYSSFAKEIGTNITSENFKEFDPSKEDEEVDKMSKPITDVITEIVKDVMSILRLVSGLIMIIALALFGLYRVLAANPELTRDVGILSIAPKNSKVLMDAGRVIIIGSILVFSASSIVEFVMNLFL